MVNVWILYNERTSGVDNRHALQLRVGLNGEPHEVPHEQRGSKVAPKFNCVYVYKLH